MLASPKFLTLPADGENSKVSLATGPSTSINGTLLWMGGSKVLPSAALGATDVLNAMAWVSRWESEYVTLTDGSS